MDAMRKIEKVTPEEVMTFLLTRYSEAIIGMQLNLAELPDDFDLLLNGVIDSFGILEMITAIDDEFRIQLDLALLDAKDITKIGPLARYVAATARRY